MLTAVTSSFILHPSSFILPTRPVSSARLERQSYKLDVESSNLSPAIKTGRGSSRAWAWTRGTVERLADYRRPAPTNSRRCSSTGKSVRLVSGSVRVRLPPSPSKPEHAGP